MVLGMLCAVLVPHLKKDMVELGKVQKRATKNNGSGATHFLSTFSTRHSYLPDHRKQRTFKAFATY